jgi:hypothetical protein
MKTGTVLFGLIGLLGAWLIYRACYQICMSVKERKREKNA